MSSQDDDNSNVKAFFDGLSDMSTTDLAIIIGGSLGLIAVLLFICYSIKRRGKRNKRNHGNNKVPIAQSTASSETSPDHPSEMSADIQVGRQTEEISTLGEPSLVSYGMFGGGSFRTLDTKQFNQIDDESTLAYGNMETAMGEPFDIVAPAGPLGLIIDAGSDDDGLPMVHTIKETSILAYGGIQVGDRLVSIDGDGLKGMSAKQVSKRISRDANQSKRILIFVRPQ